MKLFSFLTFASIILDTSVIAVDHQKRHLRHVGTQSQTCRINNHCDTFSSYCGGCKCLALKQGDVGPRCTKTVNCLVDPCLGKQAVCNNGQCKIQSKTQSTCETNNDCRTFGSYCDGCKCLALNKGDVGPQCTGSNAARCFLDPCLYKQAACNNGQCEIQS